MIFEDVLLLYTTTDVGIQKLPTNLREEHLIVLKCLGPIYQKMYFCDFDSSMWDSICTIDIRDISCI